MTPPTKHAATQPTDTTNTTNTNTDADADAPGLDRCDSEDLLVSARQQLYAEHFALQRCASPDLLDLLDLETCGSDDDEMTVD